MKNEPNEVTVFMQDTSDRKARLVMLSNSRLLWHGRSGAFQAQAFVEAARFANQCGIQPTNVCLMKAAGNVDAPGYRQIKNWYPTESHAHISADAIHVREPRTMTMFQSSDCASGAAYNRKTGESILYHCGRPAGMPDDGQNIITDVLDQIAPDGDMAALEIIFTGSICGAHLPHLDGLGRKQADAYLDEFGPSVFYDVATRSLDMRKVITAVHLSAGVELHQITFFGPDCTYAAPCCASNRRDTMQGKIRQKGNSILWLTM